ncbi:uncharacterized protein TNCV_1273351 [Trichonephila clavipes]|nr:uncharacterized protein TNCV_1273351 [Trichonephila clavipes]
MREMITRDHYRSILADHLHSMLQTLFPEECPVFQVDNAPVHSSHKGITNWVISEVSHIMEKLESICVKFIKDVVLRNIIQFIKNAESAIRTRIIIILDEIFNKINHIFNEDEDYRAVKAILAEAKEKLIRKWEDRERITEDALQSMKESVKVKFDKLVMDKFQVVKYEPERGSIKLKVHLGSAELQILQNELRTIQRILKQRLEV